MGIKISKIEQIEENKTITTPLYGAIDIVSKIDENEYTYFDTVDNYDLYINVNADKTVAIKSNDNEENITNESIDDKNIEDTNDIKDEHYIDDEVSIIKAKLERKYPNLEKVEWAPAERAIIIKADNAVLQNIIQDYRDDIMFKPTLITDTVLFLDVIQDEIKLEEDTGDIIDKLDDSTIKSVLGKVGISTSGSENHDELQGMLKGVMSTSTKK